MLDFAVYLFGVIIPIFRKIRYTLLLPFTPILIPITDYVLRRMRIKVDSEMKSNPDICVKDGRFYARVWSDQQLGFEEAYTEGWWTSDNLEQLYDKLFYFFGKHKWLAKVHIAYWEAAFRWGFLNTGREDCTHRISPEYELREY